MVFFICGLLHHRSLIYGPIIKIFVESGNATQMLFGKNSKVYFFASKLFFNHFDIFSSKKHFEKQ